MASVGRRPSTTSAWVLVASRMPIQIPGMMNKISPHHGQPHQHTHRQDRPEPLEPEAVALLQAGVLAGRLGRYRPGDGPGQDEEHHHPGQLGDQPGHPDPPGWGRHHGAVAGGHPAHPDGVAEQVLQRPPSGSPPTPHALSQAVPGTGDNPDLVVGHGLGGLVALRLAAFFKLLAVLDRPAGTSS
jgi:hypothetical protein